MKLVVKDIHPSLDGEYDFPREDTLTNRDLRFIKRESGVRVGELQDAFEAADNDLLVCFTIIAIERSGKILDHNAIWDAPLGNIEFHVDGGEQEDVPPT